MNDAECRAVVTRQGVSISIEVDTDLCTSMDACEVFVDALGACGFAAYVGIIKVWCEAVRDGRTDYTEPAEELFGILAESHSNTE